MSRFDAVLIDAGVNKKLWHLALWISPRETACRCKVGRDQAASRPLGCYNPCRRVPAGSKPPPGNGDRDGEDQKNQSDG